MCFSPRITRGARPHMLDREGGGRPFEITRRCSLPFARFKVVDVVTDYEFSQPLSGDRYPNIAWPHYARKRDKRTADGQLNARRAGADGRLHASILGFGHFPDGQSY